MKVRVDGSIRPQAPISCSGIQHVTVGLQAEPTATLGGPLTSGATVSTTGESLSISGQAPVMVVDPTVRVGLDHSHAARNAGRQ